MTKRLMICLLIAAMVLSLLSGCISGNGENVSSTIDSEGSSAVSADSSGSSDHTVDSEVISGYYEGILKREDVQSIYSGTYTSFAILTDGSIVGWGGNFLGTIGNGKLSELQDGRYIPEEPYQHTFPTSVVEISGVSDGCVRTVDGDVYVWGKNYSGNLGIDERDVFVPRKVDLDFRVEQIVVMSRFSLFLSDTGEVYHSGRMIEQSTSYEDFEQRMAVDEFDIDKQLIIPTDIQRERHEKLPLDFKCKKIAASASYYVFLDENNQVYIQGTMLGNCYHTSSGLVFSKPTIIDFPEPITEVVPTVTNLIALSESGKVYVFGKPESALSDPETDEKISDLIYRKKFDTKIAAISGESHLAAALDNTGHVYAWGVDFWPLIPTAEWLDEELNYNLVPTPTLLEYEKVQQLSIGANIGAVITENGEIFLWGKNSSNQLIVFE